MKYLLIGMLFISSALFAQSDQKSENILDKMSSEIKSLKSFYIEFTMNVKNPATGENSNQKGLGYVKGDKYYASLGQNTLVSNAIKNWTIVKEEKVTYQSDVDLDDDESMNPKKLMTIWENGFKSKYTKTKKCTKLTYFQPIQEGLIITPSLYTLVPTTMNCTKQL